MSWKSAVVTSLITVSMPYAPQKKRSLKTALVYSSETETDERLPFVTKKTLF